MNRFLRIATFAVFCASAATAHAGALPPATCPTIAIDPTTALPDGSVSLSYSQTTFTASGSTATPYVYSVTSGFPAGLGLTLDSSTGVLSGTPTQGGSFLPTITATDTNGCSGGRTYALNVVPAVTSTTPANNATAVLPTATITINFSEAVDTTASSFKLECPSGTPTAFTAAPTPPGSTTSYTLTPNANLPGNVTCTTTVVAAQVTSTADALHPTADYPFSFTTAQAPAITSADHTTFTVGTNGSFSVTTNGTPTPSLLIGGVLLPNNLTFLDNGDGTGTLSGTPVAGTGGQYAITFKAHNVAGDSSLQNFTLTVDEAPAITSTNSASFPIGQSDSFSVIATGYPAPTFSETGALPNNVTLNPSTGALAGTPQALTAGAYPITLKVSNGISPDATQPFTLTVTCPTITLIPAAGALLDATFGVAYNQGLDASGGTAPYTFAQTSGSLPGGVSLSGTAIAGTPSGATGTGSFSLDVQATDTLGCTGSASYTLKSLPNVQNATYNGGVGNTEYVAGAFTPLPTTPYVSDANGIAGDIDAPAGYTLGSSAPSNGAVTLKSDGTFKFTPTAGFAGPSGGFTYTVTSNGVSANATVTVNLSKRVWYVNAALGSNGNGESQSPFNVMSSAQSNAGTNDTVYVYSGGSPAGISLNQSGETLWGAGTAFALNSLSIPAASNPTLTGTVTIANNNVTISSLNISTGASTGLTNSGTITGATVENSINVTTTTGTAVSLGNAGGAFTFKSVSAGTVASGPTNGIVLSNTTGSFAITGDGSTAASGGTIQSTTAEGIFVTGPASNASFSWMAVNNPGTHGILSMGSGNDHAAGATTTNVGTNNLTIDHCTVSDAAGSTSTDDGINAFNTTGNLTITNTTVNGARHQGIFIDNNSNNMAALSLSGNTVTNSAGGDGVLMEIRGTSILTTGTIGTAASPNTFSNSFSTGLQVTSNDTANIQSLTIASNTSSGNNAGMDLDVSGPGSSMTVVVQNNSIQNSHTQALNLVQSTASTSGALTATLKNNTIGTPGTVDSGSAIGDGIRIANGVVNVKLTIDGNVINEVPNASGIDITGSAYVNGTLLAQIINNTIGRPSGTNQAVCGPAAPCPSNSIFVLSDSNQPTFSGFENVCLKISGNTAYDPSSWALGAGNAAFYFARRTSASNTMRLEGTQANVTNQITSTNTITNLTTAPGVIDENTSGTVAIVAAGTCGAFP